MLSGEVSGQNAAGANHDISEPVLVTKIFMDPMQLHTHIYINVTYISYT